MGQDSAEALDVVHHLVRELAVVEALDSLVRNQFKSIGKVVVLYDVAHAVEESVIGVETHCVVVGLEVLVAALDVGIPSLRDGETLAGKVDDRLKHLTRGHGSPLLQSRKGSVDYARDGNGCHCRRIVGTRCLDLARNGFPGSLRHVFDGDVLVLVGQIDGHLSCSAHTAGGRLKQTDRIDHAHCGIDGVSAPFHDVHCNLGSKGTCTCGCTVGSHGTGSENVAREFIFLRLCFLQDGWSLCFRRCSCRSCRSCCCGCIVVL